jgi:predicted AAA+ superfamily ATPase
VAESTLVSWVEDVTSGVAKEWLAAAASVGHSAGPNAQPATGNGSAHSNQDLLDIPDHLEAPQYIAAPLSKQQQAALRARIGGKWKWSDALPELVFYYQAHGFGVTSENSTLQWQSSALVAFEQEPVHAGPASIDEVTASVPQGQEVAGQLQQNTERHAAGQTAQHVVFGSEDVKTACHLLWDVVLHTCGSSGVRLVKLNVKDLNQLDDLGYYMAQYPRVRFVVVCPHASWEELWKAASLPLSGSAVSSWPTNALLYIGTSPANARSIQDSAYFGLSLHV